MTNRQASNAARQITAKLSLDSSHIPANVLGGLRRIVDKQLRRVPWTGDRSYRGSQRRGGLRYASDNLRVKHGKRPERKAPELSAPFATGGAYAEFCNSRGLSL